MSITLPEEASLMTMVVTIRFRPAALPGDRADLPVNTWRVRLGALTVGTDALGAATVRLRNHARDTSASRQTLPSASRSANDAWLITCSLFASDPDAKAG